MALNDIKNETAKQFFKKSAKMYMKDVLKGAIVVAVLVIIIIAYHLFTDESEPKSGFGEYIEGIENAFKDTLHIGNDDEPVTEEPVADTE